MANAMIEHSTVPGKIIRSLIRSQEITFAGNRKLKIYGTLHCHSGKRMKAENRVFFKDESSALQQGFRPCGHCLNDQYKKWKARQ